VSDPRQEGELVQWFGTLMLEKLRQNSHKPHWSEINIYDLMEGLRGEVRELESDLNGGNWKGALYEAADVANFAAMIAASARQSLRAAGEAVEEPAHSAGAADPGLTVEEVVRNVFRLGMYGEASEALVAEYGRQRVAAFAASDEKQAHAFANQLGEQDAKIAQLKLDVAAARRERDEQSADADRWAKRNRLLEERRDRAVSILEGKDDHRG
jgi:hypothetical protein